MKASGTFQLKKIMDTAKHAKLVALKVKAPSLILLQGDLGVGKTEWVRFFLKNYFKNQKLIVNSPTYSLVNTYEKASKKVVHMDLYRIQDLNDLESIGFWDFMAEKNIICIEWAGTIPQNMIKDRPHVVIQMKFLNENERELTCFFKI